MRFGWDLMAKGWSGIWFITLPFFLKHDVGTQIQNDAACVSEMAMLWDYNCLRKFTSLRNFTNYRLQKYLLNAC